MAFDFWNNLQSRQQNKLLMPLQATNHFAPFRSVIALLFNQRTLENGMLYFSREVFTPADPRKRFQK